MAFSAPYRIPASDDSVTSSQEIDTNQYDRPLNVSTETPKRFMVSVSSCMGVDELSFALESDDYLFELQSLIQGILSNKETYIVPI